MVETRNNDRIEAPASRAVQPEALSPSDFIAGTGPIVPVFTITGDTALPESMGSSSCYRRYSERSPERVPRQVFIGSAGGAPAVLLDGPSFPGDEVLGLPLTPCASLGRISTT